jgi:hypothetical protein
MRMCASAQQFATFKCEYEIRLEKNSTVEHLPGDPLENMRVNYQARQRSIVRACGTRMRSVRLTRGLRLSGVQFSKIGAINNLAQRDLVDVLGVVHSVNPVNTIMRKDGSGTEKRSVYIRDDSGHTIEVTMWSPFASREGATLEQARLRVCMRCGNPPCAC